MPMEKVPSIPEYTIINRRINRLDIKIKDVDKKDKDFQDEYIVIAIDSTGIKVTNRGQWKRERNGMLTTRIKDIQKYI